ncbi:hypothetical protein B9Z55_005799 [Caenorhabditis nigoni]|nr:hypothetical protein B9Z55_005799 [Caenorhabditis nigoni]
MSIDESLEDEEVEEVPTAQTTITSHCSSDVINEVMNPLIEQGLKIDKHRPVIVAFHFVATFRWNFPINFKFQVIRSKGVTQ